MSRWGLCRRCLVGLLHAPRAFAAGFGVGGAGAGAAVGPTSRVLTSSGSREPRSAGLTLNARRCPSDPSLSAPGSCRGYVCVFGTAVRWRTGCRSRSVKSARPASHAVLGGGRSETVRSVRLRGCFCGTPATPPPGHGGGPLGARRCFLQVMMHLERLQLATLTEA